MHSAGFSMRTRLPALVLLVSHGRELGSVMPGKRPAPGLPGARGHGIETRRQLMQGTGFLELLEHHGSDGLDHLVLVIKAATHILNVVGIQHRSFCGRKWLVVQDIDVADNSAVLRVARPVPEADPAGQAKHSDNPGDRGPRRLLARRPPAARAAVRRRSAPRWFGPD